MCFAVYLGTARREIKDRSGWLFFLEPSRPVDHDVARLLPGHLHYVITRKGCGCGFKGRSRKHRAPLAALLIELARTGPVHIYTCWEDEQGKALEETVHLANASQKELEDFIRTRGDRPSLLVIDATEPD